MIDSITNKKTNNMKTKEQIIEIVSGLLAILVMITGTILLVSIIWYLLTSLENIL